MDPVVEVRGLVNRFGDQVVHDGLDMDVRRDEVFGIVGGSGSGKSVLLRSILGLQRPQAGIVRIDGRDITQDEPRAAARRQGALRRHLPAGALYSGLTVLQNVQLPMIEHLSLMQAGARRAGAAEDPAGGAAGGCGATSIPAAALRRHDQARRAGARPGARPAACCFWMSRPRASIRSAPRPSTSWCCTCSSN